MALSEPWCLGYRRPVLPESRRLLLTGKGNRKLRVSPVQTVKYTIELSEDELKVIGLAAGLLTGGKVQSELAERNTSMTAEQASLILGDLYLETIALLGWEY